jgi:catechol 2,3-dioxygenase-like lactoylglutathione lyase family enzyme
MLDHIGFGVADFKRSKAFYTEALAPLGYKLVMQVSLSEDGEDGYAGFGDDRPHFWIGTGKPLQSRLHVAFAAKTRAEVRAFSGAIPAPKRERPAARYAATGLEGDGIGGCYEARLPSCITRFSQANCA